jgi:putative hydrolase of the HAD superfamily
MFDVVAFDADDTLWFSEDSFRKYETEFVEILTPYVPVGVDIKAALVATERKNIDAYGYGVKSFGLSSMEAAITLTNGEIPAFELQKILHGVREHLTEPVRVFEGVAEVLARVSSQFRTILITKGDLAHQTRKVETSGLSHHFEHVEIVLEKDPATYAHVLKSLDINPQSFCMVGNSMKSDILPVLAIGGFGVYVPYEILWELDHAEHPTANTDRYVELETLSLVPEWLAQQRK